MAGVLAWKLAKSVYWLKEKPNKATFFSPSEVWCLLAPSAFQPEVTEIVVDSRASMHKLNKKDLNAAQLETVRTSRKSTTVFTASDEVQTNEEATVYVKDWIYS